MTIKIVCLWVLSAEFLCAQSKTTAELSGSVTDPSRAFVSDAKLSMTRADTGETRSIVTDGRGEYRFLSLVPGTYDLVLEKEGFRTESRKGLMLTVGQTASLDFELTIRARPEVIEVTGATPLIEPERTFQANTIVQDSVQTLPIDGRNPSCIRRGS